MRAFDLVTLMRPRQWTKNLVLFAGIVFSRHLFERALLQRSFYAFCVFCVISGAAYLLNDVFAGGPGWFVYEEMPAARRRSGITGRGLEGVADAFLKAFGI